MGTVSCILNYSHFIMTITGLDAIYTLAISRSFKSLAPGRFQFNFRYRKVSNIRHTSVGNEIVDNLDVVGASRVGAAPTTSSFSS